MRRVAPLVAAVAAWCCAACAPLAPPDQVRPEMPAQWKAGPDDPPGADAAALWTAARPSDDLPKGSWWSTFGDPQLDALERQALDGSFTLQAAVARLDLALAQSAAQFAALSPTVQAGGTATRARISANRPLANYAVPNAETVQNEFRPTIGVSYEFDWLGKIRLQAQSARALAEQAAADRETARLLLASQVAGSYFQMRELDEEIAVVAEASGLLDKVAELIGRRYREGAASEADLAQQLALADSSRAQLELLRIQRSQQEDALATLCGVPAAQFQLAAGRLPQGVPIVPVAMPSRLLERRPDIASAERAVAAANAQIGVARAAYYPALTLAPTLFGYDSNAVSTLATARSSIWSFGLGVTQTLFDGGRLDAGVASARAAHAAAVANYRQTVLTAIQEAQDALSALQVLGTAQARQDSAVASQSKAYRIGLVRYREGLDNSVTLALTEQNQLQAQRIQTQIRGSRFLASVALVKALGGGWSVLERSE